MTNGWVDRALSLSVDYIDSAHNEAERMPQQIADNVLVVPDSYVSSLFPRGDSIID